MILSDENISAERKNKVSVPKRTLYDVTADLGKYFFDAFMAIVKTLVGGVLWLIAALLRGIDHIKEPLMSVFHRITGFFVNPVVRYRKALKMGSAEIEKGRREKGVIGAIGASLRVLGRLIFGKRGWAVTVVNWTLPVLSCVFLFNIITYASNQTYALKLTVNGDFIGYINDETIFTEAEQMVQKRINYTGSSTEIVTFRASYEIDQVGYGSTLTKYQLTDKLLQLLDTDIAEGFGLYIGDAYFGTLTGHDAVDRTLKSLLDSYRTGEDKESVEFDRPITFVYGLYLADSFVDEREIIKTLTSKKQVASYYTVVDNDSPYSVCSKVNMTYEELGRLNPGFGESTVLYTGDQIKITQDEPFLTVIITREEHYSEPIPFETTYVDDATFYAGNTRENVKGVDGERAVTADVSYINGVEVNRRVLTRTTTLEPVTKVIAIGTKARPSNAAPGTDLEQGQMMWPVGGVDGGTITQMVYGHGGYYCHDGIDIAAPHGTPVYAAGNGYVTYTGFNRSCGNYIVIQHDNGLKARYLHLSYIDAYKGQHVTMGDYIGDVGTTGDSTGNHLHFDLWIGSKWLNPIDFLPWHKRSCVAY